MKLTTLAFFFVSVSLFSLGACNAPAKTTASVAGAHAEALAPAPGLALSNAQAFGTLHMGGQPTEADLAALAKAGTRRVISLRKAGELKDFDEKARAAELGLEYIELPFATPAELDDATYAKARELLCQSSETPSLLHCASGNRVGALWVAYRVLDQGLAWDAALAEAQAVGLKNPAYIERAKAYVASQSAQR